MIVRNHYETLGIHKGANDEDVRRAYHRLARLYHPDKNNDPKAEEKFKEVGQAYEVMKSKDRRELWEREFARQQQMKREQENDNGNRNGETKSAKQPCTETKQKTSSKRESMTKTESKKNKRNNDSKKYEFLFTESDLEDAEYEYTFEKADSEIKRSKSYNGPTGIDVKPKAKFKWDDRTHSDEAQPENEKTNHTFGFNVFMDSANGFQSFFDPFHMFYDWDDERLHRFRHFSDDDEEFVLSFRAARQKKRTSARECAGETGEDSWYDWTRAFQPMGSDGRDRNEKRAHRLNNLHALHNFDLAN